MIEAIIVRHADAGGADPAKYPDDTLRPLSEDGRADMLKIARGMNRLGLEFDAIVDSGYVRARQTSECICKAYDIDPSKIRTMKSLGADADPVETAAELRKLRGIKSIALVGHQPHLGRLIGYLVVLNSELELDLKKGGVCRLDVKNWEPGAGTLTAVLPPKVLRKLGK